MERADQLSFWGIFWIDADNKQSVEQGFAEIAKMQTPPLPSTTSNDVLRWLANTKESWLLILDNCDDSTMDFAAYMPSRGGSIVLTTRLAECKVLGTWANLDDLGHDAAAQLLLQACGYASGNQEAHIPAAEAVVFTLGQHALALVHAGAYIKKGFCTLDEYVHFFRKEQALLMTFKPKQQASRYGSVYATFEVSATALALSRDPDCGLALRLLNILAFLNREAVEENIFSRAFDECQKIEKEWEKNGMQCSESSMEPDRITQAQSELDTLEVSEVDTRIACGWNGRWREISESQPQRPSRSRASNLNETTSKQRACLTDTSDYTDNRPPGSHPCGNRDHIDESEDRSSQIRRLHIWHCKKVRSSEVIETTTRLRITRARLVDLSLIKVDDNKISMHPLVHEWAHTRLDETARKIAWEQTLSILALSAVDARHWHSFAQRLAPHIDTCFHNRGREERLSLPVIQALYRLAWHLHNGLMFQSSLSIFETLFFSSEMQPHKLAFQDISTGMSWCLSRLERHEEARNLINYMIQFTEKQLGRTSYDALEWQLESAAVYHETGDDQGALTLLEPLYECDSQLSIMDDLQMERFYSILVNAHTNLGNSEQAMVLAEKNFQSWNTDSPHSERRLDALGTLCGIYINTGQAKKAVTLLEDVINICYETSLPDPCWVRIMVTLAEAYIALEKPNEAMPHLAEAHSQLAKLLSHDGDNTPPTSLARPMIRLVGIYLDLGEISLAATILLEQATLELLFLPVNDNRRLLTLRKLARVYIRLEDGESVKKAVVLLNEVMDKGRGTLHADVEELEVTEELLAEAQQKLAQATEEEQSVVEIREKQNIQEKAAIKRPARMTCENDTVGKQDSYSSNNVAQADRRDPSRKKRKYETLLGQPTELDGSVVSSEPEPKPRRSQRIKRRKT